MIPCRIHLNTDSQTPFLAKETLHLDVVLPFVPRKDDGIWLSPEMESQLKEQLRKNPSIAHDYKSLFYGTAFVQFSKQDKGVVPTSEEIEEVVFEDFNNVKLVVYDFGAFNSKVKDTVHIILSTDE